MVYSVLQVKEIHRFSFWLSFSYSSHLKNPKPQTNLQTEPISQLKLASVKQKQPLAQLHS